MLVKDWMTTDPITVSPETAVIKASQILKENNIRRLPVTDGLGRVVGLVSESDIREASPSKSKNMDVHELYYLLNELKVKDIMSRRVITIAPGATVEKAAVLMLENKITGLPVVDDGQLVGMLSQGDVFRVLTSITGIYRGGTQIAFSLDERPGSIKDVADIIRKHGGSLLSILSSTDMCPEGTRNVYIRVGPMPPERLTALQEELEREFTVLYVTHDELSDL